MTEDVKHLFFLDYDSYPISMSLDRWYEVVETRVMQSQHGRFYVYEFRHLVKEL